MQESGLRRTLNSTNNYLNNNLSWVGLAPNCEAEPRFGDKFMGNVILSPNMKKTRARLHADGTVTNLETGMREKVEEIYTPAPEDVAKIASNPPKADETKTETNNPIADMIKKQVQEAVLESIKEIDLKSIINQAIKDALK
jgi:hypothetical protein